MRYLITDTKTIEYDFLDTLSVEDKKVIGTLFDIANSYYLLIQKVLIKCNNMYIHIVRDNKGNILIQDLRGNSSLRFSNSKNIDRWIDINDFLEEKFSLRGIN